MEDEKFDCIIVGGGVAGCAAAYTLAKNNCKILLVEKGEWTGSKNVSGGVLWGPTASEIFPALLDETDDPPFERYVDRRRLSFMTDDASFSIDYKNQDFAKRPYNGVSVLRSKFDKWLGEQVEQAISESDYPEDSFVATEIVVDDLVFEGEKIVGIKAGEDEFLADCVIIAEGINNLLTRKAGFLEQTTDAHLVATGIKEVWQFDQDLLEAKFQLDGLSGMSNEFVGCTQGVEGGGFLYTNRDTISIGLVLGIASLRDHGKAVYDLLDHFKEHPSIAPILKGGKMIEYSAHVVPVGDIRAVPKKLYKPGAMVVGDSAGLLMNTGKSIEGMNMAMESGRQAALAVVEAKKRADFSASSLSCYQDKLAETFVLQDMHNFQGAVKFIHNEDMFTTYPQLINDIMKQVFLVDGSPKKKTRDIVKDCIDDSGISYYELMKTAISGGLYL